MTTETLRMDSMSAGEAGGLFAGIVALIASLGGGIRWAIGWRDRRQELREAKLSRWEESLARREKEIREATEARLGAVEEKLTAVSIALFEALGELQRLDPANPVMPRAREVLVKAYPTDFTIPPEMSALLRRIDGLPTEPPK